MTVAIRTRFMLLIIGLLVFQGITYAQESTPGAYMTQAALSQAVIPTLDRVALAQHFRHAAAIPPTPSSPPFWQVGDHAVFNAINNSASQILKINATVHVISEHLVIWVDDRAHVNDTELGTLAAIFDSQIYGPVRDLWGSEAVPGIDGDPRLHALFAFGLSPAIDAYYYSNNTYPAAVIPSSNEHEMFFFNLDNLGTTNLNTPYIQGVVAHEFQHMIRDHVQSSAAYWMDEGFSTFTQLYLYGTSHTAIYFLTSAGTQLNTWSEDAAINRAHYGAALLFTDYLYERYGLDAIRELSADPSAGLDAVDNVLRRRGTDVNTFFADWTLANYLMDRTTEGGRYGYANLPPELPGAAPRAVVSGYPYVAAATSSQYTADYYVLNNLRDIHQLEITLSAPVTVNLLPTTPASGRSMWYSNRAEFSDTTLTRAFDLRGVTGATLTYHAWYDLEDQWDYGYVMVSADGGGTWNILPTAHTTDANPNDAAYGPGYTGSSPEWIEESVPLDAYAGKEILVRFEVITDDAITQPGLALDDVSIPEIGYFSDFEAGGDDWQPQGWVWMDNTLPQNTWVQ
ncbi:MAG: immune inhibitor A, partial [Anaerolineae bacterium]|nr:immune inhibitor A [Anaerolineae bacterium]